jgi:hypothetical protein
MKRLITAISALILVALPAVATAAPNLPIVERSIDFHGGHLYEHAEIRFQIVSRSGAFDVEVRQDGGMYRYAVIDDTDEGRRSVIVTNDDVTVLLAGEPQEVPADREQRLRDFVSARIYFPLLPYRLADPGVHQEDLGLEDWPMAEGRTRRLHKVKVTFEAGSSTDAQDEYLYWFDPETGRLEQLAYSFRGGLRFRVAGNFRRVGGILFSDQENHGIDWEDQADARPVDVITPAFVEQEMEHISTVRVREIRVEELD